jgi:hypothetical protein
MPFPQHDPLAHKHFPCNLIFGRVREYFQTTRTLTPFSLTFTSFDTTLTFTTLHFEQYGLNPFVWEDYKPY